MSSTLDELRLHANDTRYQPESHAGHYESFFVRANHPTRPLAFWIRYTIFSPIHHPEQAVGELWAIAFDGETGRHVAVKRELPYADCAFGSSGLSARVGEARLEAGSLAGEAESGGHTIRWEMTYTGDTAPLLLLPLAAYARPQPKAKSLVAQPLAVFSGTLTVDGSPIEIVHWTGSQNHNWGERHTDHYAWGQVAGFSDAPETFLEVVTARRRLGPLWSPFVTLLVVRHKGEEIALNSLSPLHRARGSFKPFTWSFRGETEQARVAGEITAPVEAFVGLTYHNPPGGDKYCLNTKLATCALTIEQRAGSGWGKPERLAAPQRAAFEILTDHPDARVPLRV